MAKTSHCWVSRSDSHESCSLVGSHLVLHLSSFSPFLVNSASNVPIWPSNCRNKSHGPFVQTPGRISPGSSSLVKVQLSLDFVERRPLFSPTTCHTKPILVLFPEELREDNKSIKVITNDHKPITYHKLITNLFIYSLHKSSAQIPQVINFMKNCFVILQKSWKYQKLALFTQLY